MTSALLATLIALAAAQAQTAATAPPAIPLIPGLAIINAARTPEGDYEATSTVDAISANGVQVTVSADAPQAAGEQPEQVSVTRTVRLVDLKDARTYKYFFNTLDDAVIPGTTAFGTSSAVLLDLRAHSQVRITLDGRRGGLAGLVDDLLASTGSKPSGIGGAIGGGSTATGTLKLVEAKPVSLTVIVNSVPTMLPAYHARGRIGEGDEAENAELFILDDPANPIVLRLSVGSDASEVIKIEFPVKDASKVMEQQLKDTKRSAVYGIYFDFNSATIKSKSEPVLKEIVAVMQREPGWKLKIEGHTDSVGGNAAQNRALSARRAAAVKTALVALGIPADRLDTAGYGASSPLETNTTIAGRARNRRVELSRE